MADNLYAVWQAQDGHFFLNPNCYFTVHQVGDVVGDAKCVKTCSLDEAEKFVAENNPPESDFLSSLIA